MKEEKPSKHYTGAGYLKVGIQAYVPLYKKIIGLLPSPNKCSPIMDLGCGVGYLSQMLRKRGYENYTGLDFSQYMIEHSQRRSPKYEYILLNLYDETFKEIIENHRLFIITETLEHLSRDLEVLDKIPNGAVIIGSVPNSESSGHVRVFKNMSEVVRRYDCVIDFNFIQTYRNNPRKPNNKVMVFRGVIKND